MNVGVVGSGKIVPVFLESTKIMDNFKANAIVGRIKSKEKLEKLALDYNIEKIYYDYDEFLNDNSFEVIYIALINSLHFEYALKAIRKHKHVIIEKPICVNTNELKELYKASKEEHVMVFEAITNQYIPAFNEIKNDLKKLGKIKMVVLNFSQYSSRYDAFRNGEILPAFSKEEGGGALMDINVYNIQLMLGLFGKPLKVEYHANMEHDIDTSGVLIMHYPHFKAVAVGTKDCDGLNSISIEGEDGYIKCLKCSSRISDYSLVVHKQEEYKHIDTNPLIFIYELSAFKEMIETNDFERMEKHLLRSIDCMEILDVARRQNNII